MIKFIFKILKLLFALFIAFFIFAYIFSLKNNMPFESAISYFKSISAEFLGINISKDIITNNQTIITSTNNHYYYEQLDDIAKYIYTSLENNIDNLKKEKYTIDFSTHFNDLLNETTGQYKLKRSYQSALDAFYYDHPEIFYIDLSNFSLNTKCISIGALKTYTVEIVPSNDKSYLHSSFKSEQEVDVAIKKVENIKNDILNTVSKFNTYDKIKFIHDILVNSVEYDTSLTEPNIYNIYGALVDKKVVCEGYAKTFKYIMDCLNIECILVSGNGSSNGESESHMWNYVKLNDDWYGVDVTWDDPISLGNTTNYITHTNFLKGDNVFSESHFPNGKISDTGMLFTLPTLSNKNYN